jgi:PHP family Zn ribbon phosphoesterase
MLRWLRADLHIHTCLSPCSDLTMSPLRIVNRARAIKLGLIAVSDHNSAENAGAAIRAARNTGVTVIAGMEIASSEEVHILALFDELEDALSMQAAVYAQLPEGENKPDVFGDQIVVNERDEVEDYSNRLLIGATKLTVARIIKKIHQMQGLAIASHVDRPSYSILSQLGFIPDDIDLDAVEISPRSILAEAVDRFPEIRKFPIVTSSDAHELKEIGRSTTGFYVAEPTVPELRKALRNQDGRKFTLSLPPPLKGKD